MGQSNSRSKNPGYAYPHPGAFPPPGAAYGPGSYPVYPGYPQPSNQHMVVPYPFFAQPSTQKRRTKRRRASANDAPRQQLQIAQAPSISRHANPAPAPRSMPAPPPPLFTPMTNGGGEPLANFPVEPQIPHIVSPPRRHAQTPYHAPNPPLGAEDDEDEQEPPPQVVAAPVVPEALAQHRRRHTVPLQQHPETILPQPVNPPRPSAFDLPLNSPSRNPLPHPPRDLFDSEAYKAVLDIPRGTDLFTALYAYQRDQAQQPGQDPNSSNIPRTRTGLFGRRNSRGGGGLFRTLTGTRGRKQEFPQPTTQETAKERIRAGDVRLVPFPVPVERLPPGSQPTQGAFIHVPPSEDRYVTATLPGAGMGAMMGPTAVEAEAQPDIVAPPPQLVERTRGIPPFPVMQGPGAAAGGGDDTAGPSQINAPFPVMTAPPRPGSQPSQPVFPPDLPPPRQRTPLPPFIFTQSSPNYQGFFPHSPHRVLHQNQTYPTATHLHEALKYLPAHPTIASNIRLCVNLADVYPLSAANTAYVRSDWGTVFLQEMEKVLELKFSQHPELKNALVVLDGMGEGGDGGGKGREIVYRDDRDTFWGDGGGPGRGTNELGKILRRVRDRLVEERERGLRGGY